MPEPVNASLQMPGYSAGTSTPGVAKKLVVRAQRGDGEAQAEVSRANRMFRLKREGAGEQPEHRLASRDIRSVDEVTRGLGLDSQREQQVQTMVGETRADGGAKSQTHRIFLALDRLNTTTRSMKDIPSETRQELARRARAFWMNTQQTDYGKEPTVRAPGRPQAREDTTMKKAQHTGQRFVIGARDFMSEDALVKKFGGPPTKGPKKTTGAKPSKKTVGQAHGPLAKKREAELAAAAKAQPKGAPPKSAKPAVGAAPGVPGAPGAKPPIAAAPGAAPAGVAAKAPGGGADASGAKGAVSLNTPPPGFVAIPGSKKGGFHKQEGASFVYWYPGVGITTTAHPEDAGAGAKPAPGAAPAGKGPPPVPGAKPAVGAPPGAAPGMAPGAPPPPPAAGATPGAAGPQGAPMAGAAPQAGAKPGTADPKAHHKAEHGKHISAARAAMAQGDSKTAQLHQAAAEHHRHAHNSIAAQEAGRKYKGGKPPPPMPEGLGGAAPDASGEQASPVGVDPIADSYGRAQSGSQPGEDGERATAADPRQRHIPESETVKGMREALGKGVNVMADLSAAHDHLSALASKRKQIAGSGHPLARRMVSQINAEIAATKHDIVQLEDAHGHAMKEVAKWQSQMRSEQIKANPIFKALMQAFATLQAMGQKLMGGAKGKPGEEGDPMQTDGAPASADDASDEQGDAEGGQPAGELTPNPFGATPGGPKADALDLATHRAKALGQADDSIVDPKALAKQQAIESGASPDVLDALGQQDEAAGAQSAAKDKAANMARVLAVLGEKQGDADAAPEHATTPDEAGALAEGETTEALGALDEPIEALGSMKPKAKPGVPDLAPDTGQFDAEIAANKKKVEAAESAEDEALAPYGDMDTMSRLKALKFGGDDDVDETAPTQRAEASTRAKSGVQKKPEKGTVATGPKRKKTADYSEAQKSMIVEASARLVKSEAWARVLRLVPRVESVLKKASAPRLVIPLRKSNENFNLISLYG